MAKRKYSHLAYRLTYLADKPALVALTFLEILKEYLSTFNRQIQTQFYNELRRDYSFPFAVGRLLSDLFTSYVPRYSCHSHFAILLTIFLSVAYQYMEIVGKVPEKRLN